jgi:hypothetical protein
LSRSDPEGRSRAGAAPPHADRRGDYQDGPGYPQAARRAESAPSVVVQALPRGLLVGACGGSSPPSGGARVAGRHRGEHHEESESKHKCRRTRGPSPSSAASSTGVRRETNRHLFGATPPRRAWPPPLMQSSHSPVPSRPLGRAAFGKGVPILLGTLFKTSPYRGARSRRYFATTCRSAGLWAREGNQ